MLQRPVRTACGSGRAFFTLESGGPPATAGGSDSAAIAGDTSYFAGSNITVSFVAFATAAIVNGKARGVTARQSAS